MLRVADSAHHHSEEDVSEYLATARSILDAHGMASTDYDATLAALIGLLASKQIAYEQVTPNSLGILR